VLKDRDGIRPEPGTANNRRGKLLDPHEPPERSEMKNVRPVPGSATDGRKSSKRGLLPHQRKMNSFFASQPVRWRTFSNC